MTASDEEVYGDFEDLETGEKHKADQPVEKTENEEPENPKKRKASRIEESNMSRAELIAKKMKLKAKFDSEYDDPDKKNDNKIEGDHQYYDALKAEALRQSELNRKEFSSLDDDVRVQIEGFRAGMYVRMNFKAVSSEFVDHFEPNYPVLIGGLNMAEENVGYVTCKVKKHRWYKKLLKTGDPVIISLGWSR
jgi:ribosome biogenesis protein BMS1